MMKSETKWRWTNSTIKDDPDNVRNVLVIGDELMPLPEVILECGNIDAVYMKRIAAVPELMRRLTDLLARLPIPDQSMRYEVNQAKELLKRLKG